MLLDSDPARRRVLADKLEGWYGKDFQVLQLPAGQEAVGALTG
ncbi:hypothetical protein [Streptomyces sp. ISL-11]|nr:hypothetical protein [Streptomyces sp. ISL-11]